MKCEIKDCKRQGRVEYKGHQVCIAHWSMHSAEDTKFNLEEEFRRIK